MAAAVVTAAALFTGAVHAQNPRSTGGKYRGTFGIVPRAGAATAGIEVPFVF